MTQKQFLDKWLPEDASPEAEDTFRAELAMVAQPASFLTQQTINAAAEKKYPYSNALNSPSVPNIQRTAFLAGAAFAQSEGMRWVKASERLPEKDGEYVVIHYDAHSQERKVVQYNSLNRFYHHDEGFFPKHQIKWLEECSTPTNKPVEKTL